MKRLSSLILAVVAVAIGWAALQQAHSGGWKDLSLQGLLGTHRTPIPAPRGNDTIRVATFNIQAFGEAKLNDPEVMQVTVSILKNFDLVAIQEIRAVTSDIMPPLIDLLNADGRCYDYALGPRLGRTSSKEQYAFVFDTQTIEIDHYKLYTVDDPDDLLHREPLVGWFRARGPAPEQAFTFSLATVRIDPDEADQELDVLDDVFFRVRDDAHRREDDCILAGDFNAKESNLRELGKTKGLVKIITGETPTNTRRTAQHDNIVFQQPATTEFTGRGGVFDFMTHYNLTPVQAERVSDHLPVWAEFSVFEGGRAAPLARRPRSGAGF